MLGPAGPPVGRTPLYLIDELRDDQIHEGIVEIAAPAVADRDLNDCMAFVTVSDTRFQIREVRSECPLRGSWRERPADIDSYHDVDAERTKKTERGGRSKEPNGGPVRGVSGGREWSEDA